MVCRDSQAFAISYRLVIFLYVGFDPGFRSNLIIDELLVVIQAQIKYDVRNKRDDSSTSYIPLSNLNEITVWPVMVK